MASASWGEITSAEGLNDWGRRAVPLLNYTLALQLRKSTDRPSKPGVVTKIEGGQKISDIYPQRSSLLDKVHDNHARCR
jgi:hypothetical protein